MQSSTKDFDILNVVLFEEQIHRKVADIASEIDAHYTPTDELILLVVLNGAMYFGADLSSRLKTPHQIECIRVTSYEGGTKSSGNVKILDSIRMDLENKHVLIVDEILDTGRTLHSLENIVKGMGAKSVSICTLLEKECERQFDIKTVNDTVKVPEEHFLVGYGLDYKGFYRNMRSIVNVRVK